MSWFALSASLEFLYVMDPYGHYKYSYSAGIDFRRHNLTSTDVRFWRLKSIPALWGLREMGKTNKSDLVEPDI